MCLKRILESDSVLQYMPPPLPGSCMIPFCSRENASYILLYTTASCDTATADEHIYSGYAVSDMSP